MVEEQHVCPVCGWPGLPAEAWEDDSPSDEICPCCGTQFGLDDAAGGAGAPARAAIHRTRRAGWIDRGAVWSSLPAPAGWDARPQLVALGVEGRLVQAAEVRVVTTDVDLVSGLLWGAGVTAVGELPQPDGTVVLRSDLPPGGVEALQAAIGERWLVGVATVDDGLDAWRDHARVVRAGRVVVHPPWVPLGPVAPGEVVVEVDPGPTFGHGAHPTTRLCLATLDHILGDASDGESPANRRLTAGSSSESPANRRPTASGPGTILDVGCGSGVLAVAGVLLGAPRAVGVDIDPAAVTTTLATAARNGVADRVAAHVVVDTQLTGVDGRFDVVVANIGAAALRELAPALVARMAPGGTLVLSGLLDPPPPDLADAFAPLQVVADERTDGWTALILR